MPDTPTPGQVAFAAYYATRHGLRTEWGWLHPDVQRAWEAAAQAAIAQWWRDHETVICGDEEECLTLDLDEGTGCFERAQFPRLERCFR